MYSFTRTKHARQHGYSKNKCSLTEEGNSFATVQQAMIVRQSNDHDRANHNLPVDDHRFILDSMHTEYCCLWQVDDRRAEERSKDTTVGTSGLSARDVQG